MNEPGCLQQPVFIKTGGKTGGGKPGFGLGPVVFWPLIKGYDFTLKKYIYLHKRLIYLYVHLFNKHSLNSCVWIDSVSTKLKYLPEYIHIYTSKTEAIYQVLWEPRNEVTKFECGEKGS